MVGTAGCCDGYRVARETRGGVTMWRLFRRRLRASGASASLAEARSRGERADAGRRFERDMDDELAFHLQSRIDDHVRSGLSPADAERRACLEFGGMDKYKEQVRDARPLGLLEDLGRDLTYAWRSLRRTPVFALTAIIAIALGVAVNTGLVTLVYALVLRPLPVKEAGSNSSAADKTSSAEWGP